MKSFAKAARDAFVIPAFDTDGLTDRGGRETNMDAYDHVEQRGIGCWAVADGVGSNANSEVASKLAVETVMTAFCAAPAVSVKAVEALIEAANNAVVQQRASTPDFRNIATTLVVLVSDGITAVWGHVGDSRLYLLRRGRFESHTKDHGDGKGNLYAALGADRRVRPDVAPAVQVDEGDAFLLCVDGFWELLDPVEMEIDYVKATSASEWLTLLRRRVAERQTYGSDNYTAIAVRIGTVPATPSVAQPGASDPAPAAAARPFPWRLAASCAGGAAVLAVAGFFLVPLLPPSGLSPEQARWAALNQNDLQQVAVFWRQTNDLKLRDTARTTAYRLCWRGVDRIKAQLARRDTSENDLCKTIDPTFSTNDVNRAEEELRKIREAEAREATEAREAARLRREAPLAQAKQPPAAPPTKPVPKPTPASRPHLELDLSHLPIDRGVSVGVIQFDDRQRINDREPRSSTAWDADPFDPEKQCAAVKREYMRSDPNQIPRKLKKRQNACEDLESRRSGSGARATSNNSRPRRRQ